MGTIQKVIYTLNDVAEELNVAIDPLVLEAIATSLHRSMTLKARNFHSLEHIFALAETEDPIQALAAFSHDLVYYQVDRGFQPDVWRLIGAYVEPVPETDDIVIATTIPADNKIAHLTLDVFGFQPGQRLSPFSGLNEFLSALASNRILAKLISTLDLVKVTACIEATIPFRGEDDQGRTCFENLETRLEHVNDKYQLELETTQIQAIVKSALIFANRDVGNFATDDPAYFLDKTWQLISETNHTLQSANVYSIKDYRFALQKMAGFFDFLNPDWVFHQYRGFPEEAEFQHMATFAKRNIELAQAYLGLKLLPVIILEALADVTGGDAPLSLFTGGIDEGLDAMSRIEDYLPHVTPGQIRDETSPIFRLLNEGRTNSTGFDLNNSPLAAFLYDNLDDETLRELQRASQVFLSNEMSAERFLQQIPKPVLSAIAQASSITALTRSEALRRFVE